MVSTAAILRRIKSQSELDPILDDFGDADLCIAEIIDIRFVNQRTLI